MTLGCRGKVNLNLKGPFFCNILLERSYLVRGLAALLGKVAVKYVNINRPD